MAPSPSTELLALLARLGLAAPAEVQAVARRAQRLAKGLPLLDCVWVDALVQVGKLTPFQAADINAGRAERLAVESYVLRRPLASTPYADLFEATERETGRVMRLLTTWLVYVDENAAQAQLDWLLAQSPHLAETEVEHLAAAGVQPGERYARLWAVAPAVDGINAADWIVAQGRFSPDIVLEIARQMAVDLHTLEQLGLVHGDLSPAALILGSKGRIHLPHPGIRPIVRPEEGYEHSELPPAAYEALAPERIELRTPANVKSELFACGCLWWHLLAGRSPIAGGDSLGKLDSARAARFADIRRLAPEAPPQLSAVISRCLQADPARRGDSFAEVMAQLGPSTQNGRLALAELVRAYRHPLPVHFAGRLTPGRMKRCAALGAAFTGATLALLAILSPLWFPRETAQRGHVGDSVVLSNVVPARTAAAQPMPDPVTAPSHDRAVMQAAFQSDGMNQTAAASPTEELAPSESETAPALREDVLLLDAAEPVPGNTLDLRAGRIVRGAEGTRPKIAVGAEGIRLSHPNVQFHQVDFVCAGETDGNAASAMFILQAARVEFHGCTFQGRADQQNAQPVAILCQLGAAAKSSLPPRNVVFHHCRLQHLKAAVQVDGPVIASVDASQTLLLDCDALVQTPGLPLEQPLALALHNVTVRQCDCVVDVRYDQIPPRPARMTVLANGSVFALRTGIFQFRGPLAPLPILRRVQWSGEGSLLDDRAFVAGWQLPAGGSWEPADDVEINMDGIARSELSFAGKSSTEAADSKLVQWAAPVGSATSPGIDPALVP